MESRRYFRRRMVRPGNSRNTREGVVLCSLCCGPKCSFAWGSTCHERIDTFAKGAPSVVCPVKWPQRIRAPKSATTRPTRQQTAAVTRNLTQKDDPCLSPGVTIRWVENRSCTREQLFHPIPHATPTAAAVLSRFTRSLSSQPRRSKRAPSRLSTSPDEACQNDDRGLRLR